LHLTALPGAGQPACNINVERSALLGDNDRVPISIAMALVRHNGQYLLTHVAQQREVLVFDSLGRYIKTIGRSGAGPGEFRGIATIVPWRGDSVGIWDDGNARVAIHGEISSQPRYLNRVIRVREAVVLEDGQIVVNTQGGSAPDFALHTLGPDGSLVVSYDSAGRYQRGEPFGRLRRSLAKSEAGQIWSAHQNAYRLDVWSPNGQLVKTFERKPPWFPGGARYGPSPDDPTRTPGSGLIDIAIDDRGRVLLLFHVADVRWRSATEERRGPDGRAGAAVADKNLFWDTIIEVLDARSGDTLASRKLDEALIGFSDPRFAYSEETFGGTGFSLQLWRITHTCGG
jgi:hypothetical protein